MHLVTESIITLALLVLSILYVNRKPKSQPLPSDWKYDFDTPNPGDDVNAMGELEGSFEDPFFMMGGGDYDDSARIDVSLADGSVLIEPSLRKKISELYQVS